MARIRKAKAGPKLTVDPDENVLIGMKPLLRYLGIESSNTLYMWVELYGLPAIKRPDGRWMSTMTAIDEWLFLAAEEDLANRARSRGSNGHIHKARAEHKSLRRKVSERGAELEALRLAEKAAYKAAGLKRPRHQRSVKYKLPAEVRNAYDNT